MAMHDAGGPRGLLRRIWRLLDRRHRRQLVLLQFVSLFMGLSTLVGIAAVFPLFAVLGDPGLIEQNSFIAWCYSLGYFHEPRTFLTALGIGFVAVVLLSNAINLAGFLAIDRFAQGLASQMHAALYAEYLHRDYLFHARTHSATLFSRVIYDCRRLAVGIVHSALTFVTSAINCLLITVTVLLVNPLLAFAAATLLGGGYGLTYALVRRRLARNGREQTVHVIAQTRLANESFAAIKEISLSGRHRYFRDHFRARCDAIARNLASTAAIAQAPRQVAESLGAAGLVAVALWTSGGTAPGLWIARLSLLALAMYRLLPALQLAFASLARLRADADAFHQVEADLELGLRRTWEQPPPERLARPQKSIELKDAWFRYAPDLHDVLRGATLSLPAGSVIGLVGPNASGKSTLSDVLLGLLAPDRGEVSIDGIPLTAETRGAWRSSVAFVPQNPLLFDASIAGNVAFGIEAPDVDAGRLRGALQLAGLDALVASLGDRPIGERGVRLSGGQRQRIALARALYQRADFLVLDEATSALDGISEQEVVEVLRRLRGVCTTLVIAHRLSSVCECDTIFELREGAVVAAGNYAALLRESEGFRRMAGERA